MTSGEPGAVAVSCRALVRVYGAASEETQALRGVDLTISRGELTVVTGPSGSGKSSLLGLVSARDRPSAGWVEVLGTDVGAASRSTLRELRRRQVSLVPQRASAGLFPTLDVHQHLRQVASWRRVPDEAAHLVERLDLGRCASRRPGMLSGGEQQRVAVGMALVGAPALVVADEPTADLDPEHGQAVLELLAGLAERGSAVVVSSHDHRVEAHADRVVHLRHGVLAEERLASGDAVTFIDSSGRLQLPPDVLELFPEQRVLVRREADAVRLTRPEEQS